MKFLVLSAPQKGSLIPNSTSLTDRDNILAIYYDQGILGSSIYRRPGRNCLPRSTNAGPTVRLTYHITEGRQVVLVARVLVERL